MVVVVVGWREELRVFGHLKRPVTGSNCISSLQFPPAVQVLLPSCSRDYRNHQSLILPHGMGLLLGPYL